MQAARFAAIDCALVANGPEKPARFVSSARLRLLESFAAWHGHCGEQCRHDIMIRYAVVGWALLLLLLLLRGISSPVLKKVTRLCQLSGDQALKSTGENRAKALLGKSPLPFSGRLIGPKAPAVKPLAHREQPVAAG